MRLRSHQVAFLIVAVMLAHMASMTVIPLAMRAAGPTRVPHAHAHLATRDSVSIDDLVSIHAASACIDTGGLAATPRMLMSPLVAAVMVPVEIRWDVHPGVVRRAIQPEPPPPEADVRRALLQVFRN